MHNQARVALVLGVALTFVVACGRPTDPGTDVEESCSYLDFETPGDFQAGGVRMIELREGHRVWTKRFGNDISCDYFTSKMLVVILTQLPGF